MAQIFTADPETFEPLPKHNVMQHLATIGPEAEISFLEFLINSHGDTTAECHERLAELYINDTKERVRQKGKRAGEPPLVLIKSREVFCLTPFGLFSPLDEFTIAYERALVFLRASTSYRANRLLRFVPDDGESSQTPLAEIACFRAHLNTHSRRPL